MWADSLELSNPQGGVAMGDVARATFHLIDDESSNAPAGRDVSFNIGTGANGPAACCRYCQMVNFWWAAILMF